MDPAEVPPDAPRTTSVTGKTYQVLKEREMKQHGEKRTKRLALATWDAGQNRR